MHKKEVLVVVLGYGCDLSAIERYLQSVVSFVESHEVQAIIASGGFTSLRSAPGVSEAAMMADYLKECGVTTPIYLDEEALTTADNIRAIPKICKKERLPVAPIVIFCDKAHSVKVQLLARLVLRRWVDVSTYGLTQGFVPIAKQILVTPLDVLAAKVPILDVLAHLRKQLFIQKN